MYIFANTPVLYFLLIQNSLDPFSMYPEFHQIIILIFVQIKVDISVDLLFNVGIVYIYIFKL